MLEDIVTPAKNAFVLEATANKEEKYAPFIKLFNDQAITVYKRKPFGTDHFSKSHQIIPMSKLARFMEAELSSTLVLHDEIPNRINEICQLAKDSGDSEEEEEQFRTRTCNPFFPDLLVHQLLVDWRFVIGAFLATGITPFIHPLQDENSQFKERSALFTLFPEFNAYVHGIKATIRESASKLFFDPKSQRVVEELLSNWEARNLVAPLKEVNKR